MGFDFVCPAGERIRTTVGSYTGLSNKRLTTEEYLKNILLLPVDVAYEIFLAPKVLSGILKGIKNIPKVKKAAQGIIKVFKECKATRIAAGKIVKGL